MTFLQVFTTDTGYYLLAVDPKCFPLINIKIVASWTSYQMAAPAPPRRHAVASNTPHNATVANFEPSSRRVVLPGS